eukprot:s1185_g13.t1
MAAFRKWDAGMATPQHTPYGRGFETSFMYYQHANDYWNKKTGIQATGEITTCLNAFYDLMVENHTYRGPYKGAALTDACKSSDEPTPYCYEEKMFEDHSLEIIRNHDTSDVEHPLFLFHAFHLLHTPLQVPKYYYEQIEKDVIQQGGKAFDSENRRLLMAMTKYMDDTIKNLTEAFKAKGMWNNTLVVFTTDNGGPIYEPGSANNYPLRGGKYSDFEGGVRTTTFMSGGYVPKERQGYVHKGVVSVADWYTIFSELAGVDEHDDKSEEANKWLAKQGLSLLSPVDGKKGQLEAIFGAKAGPRDSEPLFLSGSALLEYPYKLVTGKQPYMVHTGPLYPNCSTVASMKGGHGPDFIDFSVLEEKERLTRMISSLAEFNKTLFVPERGETHVQACYNAMLNGGGHFGPFVDIQGYYTDKPRVIEDLSAHEKAQMALMGALTFDSVKKAIQKYAPTVVLKLLEKACDKCCTEESCDGVTNLNLPEALDLVQNLTKSHQLLALDLCDTPLALVAMGLQLPEEYGYVVLAHCMSWISNFYLTFNVVRARKQYNVNYPALYAPENHSNAEKFNSVQRAHQNTLESWAPVQVLMAFNGILYPRFAAGYGYAKNGPTGRMVGALSCAQQPSDCPVDHYVRLLLEQHNALGRSCWEGPEY